MVQGYGAAPPCLGGDGLFFHAPHTGLDGRKIRGRYAQCHGRPRDEDWPFLHDPWARSLGRRTRTASEVDHLLGDRIVTFVGASDTAHFENWVQCHLARAGLRDSKGCRWRHWGWAVLGQDNCQCTADNDSTDSADSTQGLIGCSTNATEGYSLDAMLCAAPCRPPLISRLMTLTRSPCDNLAAATPV